LFTIMLPTNSLQMTLVRYYLIGSGTPSTTRSLKRAPALRGEYHKWVGSLATAFRLLEVHRQLGNSARKAQMARE
jgi:hypothetical protein